MSNVKKRVCFILLILGMLWGLCYYYEEEVTRLVYSSMVNRSQEMVEDIGRNCRSSLEEDSSFQNIQALKARLQETKLFGITGRLHLVDASGEEVMAFSAQKAFSCEYLLPILAREHTKFKADGFLSKSGYQGIYKVGDRSYCFSYVPVGAHNWYVVALVPLDRAFYNGQAALEIVYKMLLSLLAIFAVLAAYIIYECRDKEKKLYNMAYLDDITDLGNKNSYFAHMKKMADSNTQQIWCLLLFDVHNFKWINDSFGIAVGNSVLAKIGTLFRDKYTAHGEVAFRLGSDIFLALKPLSTWETPDTYVKAVLDDIGQISVEGKSLHMKATAGGVLFTSDKVTDGHTVLDGAITAQEEAAKSVDKTVVFYTDDIIQKQKEENLLLEDLKEDLRHNRLEVFYQAKYNPYTEKIMGAEALVRWKHKEKGYIPPGVFIPIVEKRGFIWDLTQIVFTAVCRDMRSWREEGLPSVPVSINISTHDLFQDRLISFLLSNLNQYAIAAEDIELEVTETAVMMDLKHALVVLRNLKELGFKLDIDDFGTGYSSLSYLQEGIFNVIKLDRSFLLQRDKFKTEGEKLITSIIAMGKNLGVTCICEGAETKEQVEFLKLVGCDGIQGYFFAKPEPAAVFKERLSREK